MGTEGLLLQILGTEGFASTMLTIIYSDLGTEGLLLILSTGEGGLLGLLLRFMILIWVRRAYYYYYLLGTEGLWAYCYDL